MEVGLAGNFHQGPAPIAVVLSSVGSWGLPADFDTAWKVALRVVGVVVREVPDHIEVADCFVEVGLEVVCFAVREGLEFVVQRVAEGHVVMGIVEMGCAMVDPVE